MECADLGRNRLVRAVLWLAVLLEGCCCPSSTPGVPDPSRTRFTVSDARRFVRSARGRITDCATKSVVAQTTDRLPDGFGVYDAVLDETPGLELDHDQTCEALDLVQVASCVVSVDVPATGIRNLNVRLMNTGTLAQIVSVRVTTSTLIYDPAQIARDRVACEAHPGGAWRESPENFEAGSAQQGARTRKLLRELRR